MSQNERILVVGATGALGRAVIEHLLADRKNNWRIRAFTRNVNSVRAKQLAALNERIELFQGDNDDPDAIDRAVRGVYGIFCHTDFWATYNRVLEYKPWIPGQNPWQGYQLAEEMERNQGLAFLKAARAAGVQHFLYSSLEASRELSAGKVPCPHFDSKAAVERYIDQMRSIGEEWYTQSTTTLVTLPYFENFFLVEKIGKELIQKTPHVYQATPGLGLVNTCLSEPYGTGQRLIIRLPIGDAEWPMIALDDIGWFTTHVFANRNTWGGRTLRIGSEALRMNDLVKILAQVTDVPAIYEPSSLDEYRSLPMPEAEDIAAMFEFAQSFGMSRDYQALRKLHPGLMTFETWLRKTNWRGESRIHTDLF